MPAVADSVIVITGASTGIGRASALELARAGASVVVSSRREEVLCRER
jgi:NADP-dependent 3-hydroxy acid dehydrogenase YdfG